MLTEAYLRLLRMHRGRVTDPEQHVESPKPGLLLCPDTYFVGTIEGAGKLCQQTPVDVLNDRVLPFYEEHGVKTAHLLTDDGRETPGKPLSHP